MIQRADQSDPQQSREHRGLHTSNIGRLTTLLSGWTIEADMSRYIMQLCAYLTVKLDIYKYNVALFIFWLLFVDISPYMLYEMK